MCADAHHLPFKENIFSQLQAFSLIEHLRHPERFLREASRVLKERGLLIVQIPNSHFLVELHTGIPFPSFLPNAVKNRISANVFPGLYVNWNLTRNVLFRQLNELFIETKSCGFYYPEGAVGKLTRPLFRVSKRLKLFNIFPMGYVIVGRKT